MVRSKAPSKKQQKRGVDFKKIRRKIGRKLPPPNNATNTEIKSKVIILPEQSVASEKTGLNLSKKGLTLKELLQQTSHHNSKVRRDALKGIRELFLDHPEELKHKYAAIEKLRERISDDDKVVRETLYELLKSVIFPGCKVDNQGTFISLMMAYIFNAMTHLAIDVRLMAFKFLDLVVQHYPSSFSLYAEKIILNYEDILRKNQFYLQDKGKLKNALAGLERCLSLLPCNEKGDSCEKKIASQGILHAFERDVPKDPSGFSRIIRKLKNLVPVLVNCFQEFHAMPLLEAQSFDCMRYILQSLDFVVRFFAYGIKRFQSELQISRPSLDEPDVAIYDQAISQVLLKKLLAVFPLNPLHHHSEKDDDKYFTLNVVFTRIFLHISEGICVPDVLLEKFLEFIEGTFSGENYSGTRSGSSLRQKHILSLLPFIPKLISQVDSNWKFRLLQAFTKAFMDCNPESSTKLACLSTIKDIVITGHDMLYLDASEEISSYSIVWMRELPLLLIVLGDKHPSCLQVVLHLLLLLGQHAPFNSSLAQEYDNMQYSLQEFYSRCLDGRICYGPFIKLPRDTQELSICCLFYFSRLDSLLLTSLASCCLCHDLEPSVVFRIIEVLHSAYRSGHIEFADHISFFITLLSRLKVFPEKIYPVAEISNRGLLKSVTSVVCSCVSQMGDKSLVFQMLEKVILDQIALKPPLDNVCALLRMLITLDSKPSRLCEESIFKLSNFLAEYLIDVAFCIPEGDDDDESTTCIRTSMMRYYLLPCFFLFDSSFRLLNLVLSTMELLITEHSSSSTLTSRTTRISATVSVLLLLHKDVKLRKILASCNSVIDRIIEDIFLIQSSEDVDMMNEERQKIGFGIDRLKTVRGTLSRGKLAV